MTATDCRLCGKDAALQGSHIVPSFVFRWIRSTSITNFMRGVSNPNVRMQDGIKVALLCRECEQLFGAWEREFATHTFHPLIERGGSGTYGSWMLKFCASVSWRTLVYLMDHFIQGDWGNPQVGSQCAAAEKSWRDFLLGKQDHPGKHRQHLLAIGLVDQYFPTLPDRFNSYMQRSIQIDLCHTPGTIYTFTKMCGFVVLGFIATDLEKSWKKSRVGVTEGMVTMDGFDAPRLFWDYLFRQADKVNESSHAMSDRQKEITEKAFLSNPDKVIASHQFKTYRADFAAKGMAFVTDEGS